MNCSKYDKFLNKKVKVKTANGTTYKGKLTKYYISKTSNRDSYIILTKKDFAPIKVFDCDIISIQKRKKNKKSYPILMLDVNVTYENDCCEDNYIDTTFKKSSTKTIRYNKSYGNINF